jgi:hypothetical protein
MSNLPWGLIAVAVIIIGGAEIFRFKKKNASLEDQENGVRKMFDRARGSGNKVGLDPARTRVPVERIDEIASEYGYKFSGFKTFKGGNQWRMYSG